MKLLFVLPEFPPHFGGGIATFYAALLPALQRRGHDVHVFLGSAMTDSRPPYTHRGVPVTCLDQSRVAGFMTRFAAYNAVPSLQRSLAAAWAMYDQTDGGRGYDLVEVCDWGLQFVPWVAAGTGPRVVVQLHGSSGQIAHYDPFEGAELEGIVTRLLESATMARADSIHANSALNAHDWEARLGREIVVIPPALDTVACDASPSAVRSTDGLVVGRVQRWKGPTVLCDALRATTRPPRVTWIGRDMPYGHRNRSMCAFLATAYPDVWGRQIQHVPRLEPEVVARRQATARFAAIPSTWDVFNYTAAEAMRAATPVICSDGAGVSGHIESGANGFLFPSGDAARLAELLEQMMSMSDVELRRIGEAGGETARTVLAPDRVAGLKSDAYRAQMERPRPAATDEWLLGACGPDAPHDPLAFLDGMALRDLTSYWSRRMARKLARRGT